SISICRVQTRRSSSISASSTPGRPMAEFGDWGLLEPLAHRSRAGVITGDDAYLDALVAVEVALARAWAQVPGTPSVVGKVASALTALTASTLDREDLPA